MDRPQICIIPFKRILDYTDGNQKELIIQFNLSGNYLIMNIVYVYLLKETAGSS